VPFLPKALEARFGNPKATHASYTKRIVVSEKTRPNSKGLEGRKAMPPPVCNEIVLSSALVPVRKAMLKKMEVKNFSNMLVLLMIDWTKE